MSLDCQGRREGQSEWQMLGGSRSRWCSTKKAKQGRGGHGPTFFCINLQDTKVGYFILFYILYFIIFYYIGSYLVLLEDYAPFQTDFEFQLTVYIFFRNNSAISNRLTPWSDPTYGQINNSQICQLFENGDYQRNI